MLEKVQIKFMKNGPLVIEGKAIITDEKGDINETEGKIVVYKMRRTLWEFPARGWGYSGEVSVGYFIDKQILQC